MPDPAGRSTSNAALLDRYAHRLPELLDAPQPADVPVVPVVPVVAQA
jgi:hypothetical protein